MLVLRRGRPGNPASLISNPNLIPEAKGRGERLRKELAGARVRRSSGKISVTDGPFTESKELVAGFAMLQANSKEEAIQLAKDFLKVVGEGECELRQVYEQGAELNCTASSHHTEVALKG